MTEFFRSSKFLLIALLIGAIAVGSWFFRPVPPIKPFVENKPIDTPTSNNPESITRRPHPPQQSQISRDDPDSPIVADRPRFVAASSAVQRKAAENDPQLLAVASSLRDYRTAFRQNPVGSNSEITLALSGKNARGIRYLPPDAHLNEKNELTDRWDQPVFFHQISGTIMEIRSAGPDKKMWTADDEVSR